ncbi:MAG: PTS sugar transporter subunit IIA [Candidatus Adiutrix sp.]|jgi:PTS system mannose-specific IIA component|nr:PTS sugar transporter subunit IIA [Candidatus Adiutrix sp.]
MIGIVIVSHANLAQELLKTAEFIVGGLEACATVSVDSGRGPEAIREAVGEAIGGVERGQGVLILTDMFGGTPSNISLSFLEEGRVEVLSGVNLPMLIKAVQIRDKTSLAEAAQTIGEYARRSINAAGELLGGSPPQKN